MTGDSFSFVRVAKLIGCIVGINVFFIYWSVLQEKVTTKPIEYRGTTKKFDQYFFLNLFQTVACLMAAGSFLVVQRARTGKSMFGNTNPDALRHHIFIGLSNTFASPLGMTATKFVSYPTVLVAKCCKMLPIMAMGILWYKQHYPLGKKLSVVLISVGVVAFTFLSDKKKSHTESSVFGLFLVFLNLSLDAYTNTTQDKTIGEFHYSPFQMMFWTNAAGLFWQVIVVIGSEVVGPNPLVPPQLFSALELCRANPQFMMDIVSYAACGTIGQLFIFYLLNNFGSLTLTASTVTRKVFSVALSIFLNGHSLTYVQFASLVPVITGVCMDFVQHGRKKHHTHHHHPHSADDHQD
jgi:UDP-galactose transporter B1